jgi:hypothetical protein
MAKSYGVAGVVASFLTRRVSFARSKVEFGRS